MNKDEFKQYDEKTKTLIGTKRRTLQDVETGEIIEVDQITKRTYGQKAFWKVYMHDFMNILTEFECKKLNVMMYILGHTNPSDNTFYGTYPRIAKAVGVSMDTVKRCIDILLHCGFMKRVQTGVYIISPEIMIKGNEFKKQILLQYYAEIGEAEEREDGEV